MEKVRTIIKKATGVVAAVFGIILIYHLVQLVFLSHHMVSISSQNAYYSGLNGVCEVIVRDQKSSEPIEAKIKVKLLNEKMKPISDVVTSKTDASGYAAIEFETPKVSDGKYYLEIIPQSKKGKDKIRHKIDIVSQPSSGNITIHMDKTLYKPGDLVQYRVLLTDFISDKPLKNQIEVAILDGRENQVYKKMLETSDFGITSGSFALADRVNSGMYTMKVQSGSKTFVKEFEVKPYKLPKFEISIATDKEEYRVGEELNGTIRAEYFFGQPVKDAQVSIVCGEKQISTLRLNEQGECSFSYAFANEGDYEIKATVTDSSNNRETGSKNVFCTDKSLKISLKAENSIIIPGIPNEIFVFVSKPDGTPLKTYLKIMSDTRLEIATDKNGMASFFVQPLRNDLLRINVEAMEYDETFYFEFPVSSNWADVLIRPEKPVFSENEVIPLDIIKQREGTVWVYAAKNGQIISTLKTEDNQAEINLPSGAYGLIDLMYGYQDSYNPRSVLQSVASSRCIFIRPEKALNLKLIKDERVYRPGEDIALSFEATNEKGNALDSAILLTVADQALLSLADNDITLDNIKLALAQVEEDKGIDAEALYEAILNNASDSVIASLMLNENNVRPELMNRSYSNNNKRETITVALVLWSVAGVLVIILLLCILFKKFRAAIFYILGYIPVFLLSAFVASQMSWYRVRYEWEIFFIILIMFLFLLVYIGLAYAFHRAVKVDKQLRYVYIPIYLLLVIIVISLIMTGCSMAPVSDGRFTGGIEATSAQSMDESYSDGFFNGIFTSKSSDSTAGAAPAPTQAPTAPAENVRKDASGDDNFAAVEKIRKRFMEVMVFHPEIDAKGGKASITLPLADNITTWNVQAVANSLEGQIGSSTGSIQVFQEFFVDFDLPWNLTVGDEAGIPVTVSNYLKAPQRVRLQIQKDAWFDVSDGQYTLELDVDAEERKMIYIPIKVKSAGNHKLRVDAAGQKMADAVEKEVRIYPNGLLRQEISAIGTVDKQITNQVFFLDSDIPDARNIRVKLFPSSMAQVAEGLEAMLRFPDGCFEQISSSLYPNILVLKYLQDNQLSSPEIEKKAYEYIERGFQKILTYEVNGRSGGFSLYGDSPAETVLTAYGLMEFTDLSRVHDVDKDLLERMADYIFSRQNPDGTFNIEGYHTGGAGSRNELALNAYIGWALSEANGTDGRLTSTVSYLKSKMADTNDGYTLALIANVLVNTKDKDAKALLDRLAGKMAAEQNTAYLQSTTVDYYGACGPMQDLQATALASTAFSKARMHQNINNRMLNYILSARDSYGTFGSTQATILSLKALVEATSAAKIKEGTIIVKVNDREEKLEIGSDALSYFQCDFGGALKENTVEIHVDGSISYEIIKEFYVPYGQLKPKDSFDITRKMDSVYKVNDEVLEEIRIVNTQPATVENMMVLVQIPQGFTVNDTFLESLKLEGTISEYSIGYDYIEIYTRQVQTQEGRTLWLGYWAGYPVKVQTGSVTVYDYYNPEAEAIMPPMEIRVTAQ